MKSRTNKVLAILGACILMMGSLNACSSTDADTATEEPKAGSSEVAGGQTDAGSVASAEDGPFGRYEEPITIEFVRSTNSVADADIQALGESWEDNRWIRLFKDELNIEVKYRWIVNDTQFNQKWKMACASGDIPDAAAVSLVDLNQLADADLIQEMGDVWDKYASDLTKSIASADGDGVFDAIKVNGKTMGIPQVIAGLDSYRYLWLRTDWMEKLNLEPPTTIDEFEALMEAFVTQDPDGNGVDDTYAMMLDKGLWYQLEGYFWGFNAYPDTWVKTADGTLQYGAIQPEMIEPLKRLQEMYQKGWIDPEFIVKDYLKANEKVLSGKIGVTSGGHWLTFDLDPMVQEDPTVDWGCFEWPTLSGDPVLGEIELGLGSTMVVRKDYEHPEAVVKMLNLYYEKLYGETGDYSYWGNDRETGIDGVWGFGPMSSFHPLVNIIPYRDAVKVYNGEMDASELEGVSLDYYTNGQTMWMWERMWMPGNNSAGDVIDKVLTEDRVFIDNFVGASTPTMVEHWTQMNELMNTTFTKIITGQLDAETGFNDFVEDWKRIGGDQITKEVNDWYQENAAE